MNIDNQLLLGIVFITAGVAMGLLAYAAFLNRQDSKDEELAEDEPMESTGESQAASLPEVDQSEAPGGPMETASDEPIEAAPTVKSAEPIIEPAPDSAGEADTIATPSSRQEDRSTMAETMISRPSAAATPAARPTVLVDRDPASDRLMVKVDDQTYHSIEALRESDDWDRVTDLFSDLLAWMIKAEESSRADEEEEVEEPSHQPVSMIQEINTILGEKLAEMESGPQAVRLMEGAGGSIRVYIGVESFSIDEVPDAEVKALIRQAVAEWEAR